MNRSIFSIAALCAVHSAMNSASARTLTDTRHDAGAIPLNKIHSGICFIGENDDNVAGGQDNGGTPQSDSTETGGQQQEQQANPDNNAGGEPQQQSNDAGQQANSTATETAAGKVDTDESVDGRQPE